MNSSDEESRKLRSTDRDDKTYKLPPLLPPKKRDRKTKTISADIKNTRHGTDQTPVSVVGFIRVPCKARGIPAVHEPKNAYIDIPSNAVHGTFLLCSNQACRDTGRVFRYCKVCDMPTIKRNFMKRHGHGLDVSGMAADLSLKGSREREEDAHREQDYVQSNVTAAPPREPYQRNLNRKTSKTDKDTDTDSVASSSSSSAKLKTLSRSPRKEHDKVKPKTNKRQRVFEVSDREYEWLQLLNTKPSTSSNKTSRIDWIANAMTLADPDVESPHATAAALYDSLREKLSAPSSARPRGVVVQSDMLSLGDDDMDAVSQESGPDPAMMSTRRSTNMGMSLLNTSSTSAFSIDYNNVDEEILDTIFKSTKDKK